MCVHSCTEQLYHFDCFIFVVVTVHFHESAYVVNESDGIVQPVLVLSSPPAVDITIHVFSTDGSAVHDIDGSVVDNVTGSAPPEVDYEFGICVVTFQKGTNKSTLNITIIDDEYVEFNENFTLSINSSSLPSNVNVTKPGKTTVTILNNDGKYTILRGCWVFAN